MPRLQMSYICRKGVMCQHCLTAALPIVLPSLCLLFHFLANNGNGKLSLTAISCTSRVLSSICRDGENRVWTCERYGRWTAGHWALHQCTAEWGRDRASYIEIDWLQTACRRNATEQRKQLKSLLRSCRAIYHSAQGAAIKLAQL